MAGNTNRDVYLDDGVQGWIKKTAREEHWRVANWYSFDDLVQDGFVVYTKVRNKYTLGPPDALPPELSAELGLVTYQDLNTNNPSDAQRRHFMNLLQRSFRNYIHTLAARHPTALETTVSELGGVDSDEQSVLEGLMPPQPEEASVFVTLAQAPAEIRDAIKLLVEDGISGGEYLRSRLREEGGRVRRGRRGLRETTVDRLARILGDPELPGKTLAYLTP